MRPSFNRLDNFKEHILRHFRDRNNCRARTGFDPAAEEFYLGITEMVKQRRQQQQQQQHQQQQQQTLTACQRKRLGAMNIESPGSTDTCDTGSDVASDVDGDVGMMG
jgi:transcription initiation factor TFIID subunit TAF12